MSPTLNDGDYVLTKKPRHLTPGHIYVVNHSDLGRIIKRFSAKENERYLFEGDNPASTPSPIIGPIEERRVIGQVIYKIGKFNLNRV